MALIKNKYVLIFFAFFIYSFIGVVAKLAALNNVGIMFFMLIGLEIALLFLYALIWQQVLKKFSLVTAMSCKGIVIIYSLLWAYFIFKENIEIQHYIGSVIIIAGIVIVSSDKVKLNE